MKKLLVLLLLAALPATAQSISVRGALGLEATRGTTLVDVDCASTNPPALYGCVDGSDGEALASRGDFGRAQLFELGAGVDVGSQARVELMVARRDDLELDALSNFPGVDGDQPVSGDAKSTAAFLTGTWFFGSSVDARPFVIAGAGAARNEIGAVTFAFPGLAPDAVTVIRGGTNTDLAFLAGAGIALSITDRISVDLAVRYTDLGKVRTSSGPATIVRPRGTIVIPIAGTQADLRTVGVVASLRFVVR